VAQFKRGDFSTCNAPRPGGSKTVTIPYICIILQKQTFSVLDEKNGMLHKPGSGLSHSLICFFHSSSCSSHVTHTLIIIIIIISSHALGLDRPVTSSSKVFQVTFVHSVYNSAKFLPSCCSPFLLHDVASLICIFLVSGLLVLLSALTKFPHSFCCEKG